MDCRLAREQLDVARPGSADGDNPELQLAFAHLEVCGSCAELFRFRRAFDGKVGAVVRDVDVPPDFKLQVARAVGAASPRPASDQGFAGRAPSRRAALLAGCAAALLIAAGWTWFASRAAPAPLTAAEVLAWWRAQLGPDSALDLQSLPAFDGGFDPAPGDGRWSRLAAASPRGADLDGDGADDAAVYLFRGGFLVVMPPDRVSDPPSAASALAATRHYAPVPHVAWTAGHRVHLCFVPGGTPAQLEQLLRTLHAAAA